MAKAEFLTFLIVDDHRAIRRTVADILRAFGFSMFDYAEDGQKAWKMINQSKYDFVILDWNMPNMTGIEVLRKIRASEKYSELPVLMLTAEARQEDVIEAVQAGASNYVVKPFTPDTLIKKIQEILAAGKL